MTDGDTIKVKTTTGKRMTVRLVGIDTPETVDPRKPVECGGKRATAAITALVLDRRGEGRFVTLRTDPTQDERDRHGRLLAYVRTNAGIDVGRKLIAQGWATTFIYNNMPFLRVTTYQASEAAARSARRGVYRACGDDFHKKAA